MISFFFEYFDLSGRLLFEFKWIDDTKNLGKGTWENRDSSKEIERQKKMSCTLERTMETRVYGENWEIGQEHETGKEIQGNTRGDVK